LEPLHSPKARLSADDDARPRKMEESMAYLARIEPALTDFSAYPAIAEPSRPRTDFTPLEWSVIRLARIDGLWTIRSPGRIARFWNWLVNRGNPELANPQLEALRKMAVLSWHYGFTVAGVAVGDFLSAGFSPAQYELLVISVTKAANARATEEMPEVFA
jgi:hypothetical protein